MYSLPFLRSKIKEEEINVSVHEIITDRVVARIEEAIKTGERFRWCKPFTGGVKQAISYMSGLPYRGVNRLLLVFIVQLKYQKLQRAIPKVA